MQVSNETQNQCVVILGMHRSGTSAFARLVNMLGPALPKNLLEAGDGNEAGHWEPVRLMRYNDQLLHRLRSTWHDWTPLDKSWLNSLEWNNVKDDWSGMIAEEYAGQKSIVIKEPRICRFADEFLQSLRDMGFAVKIVVPFRNPIDVVNSLQARENWPHGFDQSEAMLLWLSHAVAAEHASRAYPRAIVSYEKLMSDPLTVLETIVERAELATDYNPEDLKEEIAAFLTTDLRHHSRTSVDAAVDPRLSGWAKNAYRALCDLEEAHDELGARSKLDSVAKEIFNPIPLLKHVAEARRTAVNNADSFLDQLSDMKATNGELQKLVSAQKLALEVDAKRVVELQLELEEVNSAYQNSTSWRVAAPIRGVKQVLNQFRDSVLLVFHIVSLGGGFRGTLRKSAAVLRSEGAAGLSARLRLARRSHGEPQQHQLQRSRVAGRPRLRQTDPLVSIIIINMNGLDHLAGLLGSIASQTYARIEVVFVDNGSTDGSIEFVQSHAIGAKIVKLGKNVGFAEANNIGFEIAKGEYVFLLNNDTRLLPDCVQSLVDDLNRDDSIAISQPKILFFDDFVTLRIQSDSRFEIDRSALLKSLSYQKFFTRGEFEETDRGIVAQPHANIELDVPASERNICLLLSFNEDASVTISVDGVTTDPLHSGPDLKLTHIIDAHTFITKTFPIVNNAGSALQNGNPVDRGFGERDLGQFDEPVELDLACGCAMMIRREALRKEKLFIGDLFAYFEDTELSERLRIRGNHLSYAPSAVVRHKHSATSKEKSAFWHTMVNRNGRVFRYLKTDVSQRPKMMTALSRELKHVGTYLAQADDSTDAERAFGQDIEKTIAEFHAICASIDNRSAYRPSKPRIGIYNSFWNTLGGGEAHALAFANYLQKYAVVDLISENDFEIEKLEKYFDRNLSRCRRRLIGLMTPELTEEYDIFINSTYHSSCPSRAPVSYYLVSFPHRGVPTEFLQSYLFLPNSEYTERWLNHHWKQSENVVSTIIHPAVAASFAAKSEAAKKERVILSVGRFFGDGHSKNQRQLVDAFKQLNSDYPQIAKDWRLVLIGSATDEDYVENVREASLGLNVDIKTDASFTELKKSYRQASLFWHASGLGQNPNRNPENIEHFGMSTAEAMSSGCLPLVFKIGGPADIVKPLGARHLFSNVSDLVEKSVEFMQPINATFNGDDDSAENWASQVKQVQAVASNYSAEIQAEKIDEICGGTIRCYLGKHNIQC